MDTYKENFIDFMIQAGVLTFGDFVTKSGRATPFFVNTGNYYSGSQLAKLGEFYAQSIRERFGLDFDVLFGPAYKGIPLAVAASIALYTLYGKEVSYSANRKEAKSHGEKGILLGSPIGPQDKVLIIEDVTTAGTSIRETLPIIQQASGGAGAIGLIVSVDRMERGSGRVSALQEISEEFGFPTGAIVTMREVVAYLKAERPEILAGGLLERIREYYRIYGAGEEIG